MTNPPIHPADLLESTRRKVRRDPERFAHELAEQHFNEALDMLIENAREDMTNVIYDDLRMTLPPADMEALIDAYERRIGEMIKAMPTTLEEG